MGKRKTYLYCSHLLGRLQNLSVQLQDGNQVRDCTAQIVLTVTHGIFFKSTKINGKTPIDRIPKCVQRHSRTYLIKDAPARTAFVSRMSAASLSMTPVHAEKEAVVGSTLGEQERDGEGEDDRGLVKDPSCGGRADTLDNMLLLLTGESGVMVVISKTCWP